MSTVKTNLKTLITTKTLGELRLDPFNPRLNRRSRVKPLSQPDLLKEMDQWALTELATSYIQGGFWPFEPLMVVEEKLEGKIRPIVIEGNRRLAALILLEAAVGGHPFSDKWDEFRTQRKDIPKDLFGDIPVVMLERRSDIEAFLGFRHVTGIKEWKPAEKAEYIAKLIDERGHSYEDVMRMIGSKTPSVRHHYITHRLFVQMEDEEIDIPVENVEKRFSVLYLSLKSEGARKFLQIDIKAEPAKAKTPVPRKHLKNLKEFAEWLFGDAEKPPLFSDSRQVDDFGKILESDDAITYLRSTERPNFDVAKSLTGSDDKDLIESLRKANFHASLAYGKCRPFRKDRKIKDLVQKFGETAMGLLEQFPEALKAVTEKK